MDSFNHVNFTQKEDNLIYQYTGTINDVVASVGVGFNCCKCVGFVSSLYEPINVDLI